MAHDAEGLECAPLARRKIALTGLMYVCMYTITVLQWESKVSFRKWEGRKEGNLCEWGGKVR